VARKKRPPARQALALDARVRDALDQVDSLGARGRWGRARQVLEDLLPSYPRRPELLRKLVEVAVELNDAPLYQNACERLLVLCPDDWDLLYMLTTAYVHNQLAALAVSTGRRALARDPANEKAEDTRRLLVKLEPLVNEEITRLGLDGPDALECLTLHDQSRSFLAQGMFDRAQQAAEALLKRRPRFSPVYNNGAEACFHAGRLAQAIDLEQRLLAFEPDNVYARSNLVRFLCASGKVEEARGHAERLRAIAPATKDLAVKQAEAFAWLGDDAAVLAMLDRARQLEGPPAPQDDALLYHLAAVAAYRLGREEQAQTCWRFALRAVPDFELARRNLDDLVRPVGQRNAPWSYSFNYYVPRQLIDGLVERMGSVRGKGDEEAGVREAKRYLQAHPELEGLVPLLLDRSDQAGRELALHLARLLRTPALLEAVRDFALGRRGADRLRMQAAELASQAGFFPESRVRMWLEGEWRDIALMRWEIHSDPVERRHAPGVIDLLGQGVAALQGGDFARAERILRQALAIDANDPVVLNNLAVACANQGRTEESEAISIRLYEKHPDYLFGRTALASLAAERGELDRARELLAPLVERPRLHRNEFTSLCIAQLNLHLAAGEDEPVKHWLGMLRQVSPDHPLLGSYEERLRQSQARRRGS
jgi:tetratricopeptide (TPR) repeat protein